MVKMMVETIAPTCASLHEHNKISFEVLKGKTFSVPLRAAFTDIQPASSNEDSRNRLP
jgi:hypothetical protein